MDKLPKISVTVKSSNDFKSLLPGRHGNIKEATAVLSPVPPNVRYWVDVNQTSSWTIRRAEL